jgi:hypothetical protein
MIYGDWGGPFTDGYSTSSHTITYSTDTTTKWEDSSTYLPKEMKYTPLAPMEYTLEYDGTIKMKPEGSDIWEEIDTGPDPFASEPKKKKKTVKARIKLDKKLAVDTEKLADMLF